MTVSGKFLRSTPTSIFLETTEQDGAVREREIGYTSETLIGGCTLDEVEKGTSTFVVIRPIRIFPPQADLVKFDGCQPTLHGVGVVEKVAASTVTVVLAGDSDFGADGTTVDLICDTSTQFYTCDGRMSSLDALSKGTSVSIRAIGGSVFTALSVQSRDDCPQTIGISARFLSYLGEVFTVVTEPDQDTLALRVDQSISGVPADSGLALFSCDGRLVTVDELEAGDPLSLVYLLIPRRGTYFQYAQLTNDCPKYVTGRITALAGSQVTIASGDSTYTAWTTATTVAGTCSDRSPGLDDLAVGQLVSVSLVEKVGGFEILTINILDDCPYAFYLYGIVESVDQSSLVVKGISSESPTEDTYRVVVNSSTMSVDCSNEPLALEQLSAGNTVNVYFRVSRGERIADFVIRQEPCDAGYVEGIITNVAASSIDVKTVGAGVMTYTYDQATAFSDCEGRTLEIDTAYIGQSIVGVTRGAGSGSPYLHAARVGCDTAGNNVGVVMTVGAVKELDGSTLIVDTRNGAESFAMTSETRMTSTSNAALRSDDVKLGDMVTVMSMSNAENGMPVASSVVVMDATTSVDRRDADTPFMISPNPASTNFTIAGPDTYGTVMIFDARGLLVAQASVPQVDVSQLPVGAYSVIMNVEGVIKRSVLRIVR
jgi:hypothetical protein